jgi:hypothetical protein
MQRPQSPKSFAGAGHIECLPANIMKNEKLTPIRPFNIGSTIASGAILAIADRPKLKSVQISVVK